MTQHSDAGEARICSSSVSSQALFHWATTSPMLAKYIADTICMVKSRKLVFLHLLQVQRASILWTSFKAENYSEYP